jgi:molybdopterin-guanine dinucleotide biosynthesis protein A
LKKSAIILAGGYSKRFGKDKGLLELGGKPLILHVLESVYELDEVIVVVNSHQKKTVFEDILIDRAEVLIDEYPIQSPLIGALTGFKSVKSKYSLLLSCDTPFISKGLISVLFNLCVNKNAVIPKWPNGFLEPLQAVYFSKKALIAARDTLNNKKYDLQSMILLLGRIHYVSVTFLRKFDPKLNTFFNINTPRDLEKAENTLKTLKITKN